MDKDRFRQSLGGLIEAYEEAARRIGVKLDSSIGTAIRGDPAGSSRYSAFFQKISTFPPRQTIYNDGCEMTKTYPTQA